MHMTVLLESYGLWGMEEEKAELHLVATLEDPDIPRGGKVAMLWASPSSKTLQDKLKNWAGILRTWGHTSDSVEMLSIRRALA